MHTSAAANAAVGASASPRQHFAAPARLPMSVAESPLTQDAASIAKSPGVKRTINAAGLNVLNDRAAPARPSTPVRESEHAISDTTPELQLRAKIQKLEAALDESLCWTRNWPCMRCDDVKDLALPALSPDAAHHRRMKVMVVGPLIRVPGSVSIDGRSIERLKEAVKLRDPNISLADIIQPWAGMELDQHQGMVTDIGEVSIRESSAIPFLLQQLHSDKFDVTTMTTAAFEDALVTKGGGERCPTLEGIDVLLFSSVLQLDFKKHTIRQWSAIHTNDKLVLANRNPTVLYSYTHSTRARARECFPCAPSAIQVRASTPAREDLQAVHLPLHPGRGVDGVQAKVLALPLDGCAAIHPSQLLS
jgi:hypothetical protein